MNGMAKNHLSACYEQTTGKIKVRVEPFYLEDESNPAENLYVWAYRVRIENNGAEIVKLKSRHWRITDAVGALREVHGAGVVGEHPVLRPGEAFEYVSGAHLPRPSGIMAGYYKMESSDGRAIKVDIPAFSLDSPSETLKIN